MHRISTLVILALFGLAGCATDLQSPRHRNVKTSAHTLEKGDWEIRAGFLNPHVDDLMAAISVRHSPKENLDLEMNLIHTALGLYNLNAKYRFHERGNKALSLKIGVKWFNPDYSLLLPPTLKSTFSGTNLIMIPVELVGSMKISPKFQVNIGVGYIHTVVLAKVAFLSTEGGFGMREAYGRVNLYYYPAKSVALFAEVQLPVYQGVYSDVSVETEIGPGVVLGTQSAEWSKSDNIPVYTGGIEFHMLSTHIKLHMSYPGRVLTEYSPTPILGADVYWRF
jgi:hypothetical protein